MAPDTPAAGDSVRPTAAAVGGGPAIATATRPFAAVLAVAALRRAAGRRCSWRISMLLDGVRSAGRKFREFPRTCEPPSFLPAGNVVAADAADDR